MKKILMRVFVSLAFISYFFWFARNADEWLSIHYLGYHRYVKLVPGVNMWDTLIVIMHFSVAASALTWLWPDKVVKKK